MRIFQIIFSCALMMLVISVMGDTLLPTTTSINQLSKTNKQAIVITELAKFQRPNESKQNMQTYFSAINDLVTKEKGTILYAGYATKYTTTSKWDGVIILHFSSSDDYSNLLKSSTYQEKILSRNTGLAKRLLYTYTPNTERFGVFQLKGVNLIKARTPEQIFVVNFIRFSSKEGAESYEQYAEFVTRYIRRNGGYLAMYLIEKQPLLSQENWPDFLLVSYQSYEKLVEMTSSSAWKDHNKQFRVGGIDSTITFPTKPIQ